jgi:antitoxin component of MazEF toxin-antitoxin module
VSKIRLHGRIRRVGNSLALLIPAPEAKRGGVRAGQTVHADIEVEDDDALGFLADVYDGPFQRNQEEPKLAQ